MNARKILVANTKTQRRYEIMSTASTLGELKADFDANGIEYEGLSITEGITRTMLLDDSSPIPETVMFKGEPKNPAILLTNTKDKIASGQGTRQEVYAVIREEGLEDDIKNCYGKNYTILPTDTLWAFVNCCGEEEEKDSPACTCAECPTDTHEAEGKNVMNAVYDLIKTLVKTKALTTAEITALIDMLTEYCARMREAEGLSHSDKDISNAELDEIINALV